MTLLEQLVSRAGGPALGTWIKLPGVESCEMVAAAGFDFVVIDMEHAPIGIESAHRLVMVFSLAGVLPLVRLPEMNKAIIKRLLDAGAGGVLAPHVEEPATVGDGLSFSLYPPQGVRGFATTTRAGRWGGRGRGEHIRDSNAGIVFIPQLESERALAQAAEIAAVPGLGTVFIGQADLSVAMGLAETDDRVAALVTEAVRIFRSRDIIVGTAARDSADAAAQAKQGFDFLVVGNDAGLLASSARKLVQDTRSQVRAGAAERGRS